MLFAGCCLSAEAVVLAPYKYLEAVVLAPDKYLLLVCVFVS